MQLVQVYRNLAQPTILVIDGILNLGKTHLTETIDFMFQSDICNKKISTEDLKIVSVLKYQPEPHAW
jgi:hypothetical protein